MYKNFKRLAVLFVAAATMFAVSCDKDDNTNQGTGDSDAFTTAKCELSYKINLDNQSAEALTRGYDVFIDYYDSDGTIKTSTEMTAGKLTWEKSVSKTTFPTWVGVRVRMVPKTDLSGVGEEEEFDITGSICLDGTITSTTGKKREAFKKTDIIKRGIEPHNGKSYNEALRFEIKANGERNSYTSWED